MGVIQIESLQHFQSTLGDGLAVIDFWAQFCGPCRRIAPDYEAMSNVFPQVQFFKCNTREDGPDLVSDMHGIRALPTFVFYKGKKEIKQARFEGANMDRLRGVIEKVQAFSGGGNTTGGSSGIVFDAPVAQDIEPIPNPISVDESKPKTKIQIRMQGGQKIVQEFNHDHLVADLFMFIGSKDGFQTNFILKGNYPPKQIFDDGKTIKDAGLLNANVIQMLVK